MSESLKRAPVGSRLDLDRIAELRGFIDARLEQAFDPGADAPSRLICAVRHGLLSPGKRLRPLITLLACEQLGGETNHALEAAAAVEMVHAASLVMDDLPAMDNARLRRGCLATHVVFGEGAGMLAAISLLNEAYRLIAASDCIDDARRIAAIGHLAAAVGPAGLAGGQERDIMCGKGGAQPSMGEMERRHAEKTGALFAAAAAIGGEFAGAASDQIEAMRDYGAALGLAYQALDDVIDQTESAETAGKDTGKDEGKTTVVSLLGRDGARRAAERWLSRAVNVAENAAHGTSAPLADLARLIGAKYAIPVT